MRGIKKYVLIIIIMVTVLIGKNIYAEEFFYTNRQGVSFTKEQYDFFKTTFHEGFQEIVTQEMIDKLAGVDLSTIEVQKVGICPMTDYNASKRVNPRRDDNLFIDTYAKSLEMSNLCFAGDCYVFATVEWHGEPTVKSLDLLGVYLTGTVTRESTPMTMISSSEGCDGEETVKYTSSGFGAVVQLIDGDDIFIDQSFRYSGTGTIFYSYQHAMSTISLSDAQLFNTALIGYGSVFDFYGNAVGVYDEMPGVQTEG